jgi:UDP-N-acetylmuramoyl-L-alanyl-D-glutamate--2,6-diaminopimelate ligase
MKLKDILNGIETTIFADKVPDIDINGVENDSRKVNKHSLYIAASGYVDDAHIYVDSAYDRGCRNFITDEGHFKGFQEKFADAYFIPARHIHKALACAASNFHGNPSSKMKLIGITGTSGKTTTAFAVYSALRWMKKKAGLVGTIEYRINDEVIPATNTTPDILYLNALMAEMVSKGTEYLVMEVSSHSLVLGRIDRLNFDIAAFTNFSQDHLDFHKSMDEYFEAKLKIFDLLQGSLKPSRILLVNADMERYSEIQKRNSQFPEIQFKSFSIKDQTCDFYSKIITLSSDKTIFELNGFIYNISMIGTTNVYNFTLASSILLELGFSPAEFSKAFQSLQVAGRMESVQNDRGIAVIIDYAHKPDALEKVLRTIRETVDRNGRIITVFGAGGDRDKSKRSIMGKIAAELSDVSIITSDNPRTEDPMQIIREIEMGIKQTGRTSYQIEENREKAIEHALSSARKGDCVLIAGKGHENYQIIGKTRRHFSDREEAEKFFKR